MSGIFGFIASTGIETDHFKILIDNAFQRGKDTSGLVFLEGVQYKVIQADVSVHRLLDKTKFDRVKICIGYGGLELNVPEEIQPVVLNEIIVIHDGIVVNDDEVKQAIDPEQSFRTGAGYIAEITKKYIQNNTELSGLPQEILVACQGTVSCAIIIPFLGKVVLFSNNGDLFLGEKGVNKYLSSEKSTLFQISCEKISQVSDGLVLDIPISAGALDIKKYIDKDKFNSSMLNFCEQEEKLLQFSEHSLRRCTRCILPETMPYINFDAQGVCNYCHSYKTRNVPKPKEELFDLVAPYRKDQGVDCIVPFSGGRDSCYALHLIVEELKMKPITYTYDWGMVTDLGRRNISRMCAEFGVENIVVAADISKKRRNIAMNFRAWLKSPHLGMLGILTAGDKHFFRYVESVKNQTGVSLNLWGVNPLEVTHFKTGFLNIEPDFETRRVYSHAFGKQLRYQAKRFNVMLKSPGYLNTSIWDTVSGEYYRSFAKKSDYYHVFDYWRWDEDEINSTLDTYNWERAVDTTTTWRIGDGTAGFYNYVYYTVAGFTEHDTFRSNQIREEQITREQALKLVSEENRPRYQNIAWYLHSIGFDFKDTVNIVNSMPKLY